MRNPIIYAIAVIILCMTAARAIPPPRLPMHKPSHEEPNLLTEYERKTLKMELCNLTQEISIARREAAQDSSLEAARQALCDARETKDEKTISHAQRKLADEIETHLLTQEGMPEKVKRLLEVGRFLEYDTQREKNQRRRKGTLYKRLRNQPATSVPNP